jgi:hypothetical protein
MNRATEVNGSKGMVIKRPNMAPFADASSMQATTLSASIHSFRKIDINLSILWSQVSRITVCCQSFIDDFIEFLPTNPAASRMRSIL